MPIPHRDREFILVVLKKDCDVIVASSAFNTLTSLSSSGEVDLALGAGAVFSFVADGLARFTQIVLISSFFRLTFFSGRVVFFNFT